MRSFLGFNQWFNMIYVKTGLIPDAAVRDIVSKASATAVWAIFFFTACGTAGIDTAPVLTGLGVGGASIGFAARDIGANFVAGLLLAMNRHRVFGHGKRLRIGSAVSGTVISWDLRHLILLNSQLERVYVPNSMLFSSIVTVENPKDLDGKSLSDLGNKKNT
mmetsp:Transcript_7256/g.10939  ORF Transcript_7256/g.10939 Transcript_7256/m.10939 type:complete len:162 (-) Transcript_7256:157-642(-)